MIILRLTRLKIFLIFIFCIIFLLNTNIAFCQNKTDSTKRVNFAAIPIINYNNTTGGSIGILTQLFYKINSNDTISPSSSTGLFGMYTTNNTYFSAAFQRLYLKEDTWRIMAAAGFGRINYQYWQEIPALGGMFIGFGTEATFAMARVERKVYKKLYAGVSGTYSIAKTEYDLPNFFPDSIKSDKRNMNNLGYLLNYDMREHQMNPYKGYNVEFKNQFYREWMNSGNNFAKIDLSYNHYYQIKNEQNILVTRVHAAISTGDVPFQGQNVVGQDDIRGYSNGKHRNNQVFSIQAEYRWCFYKKLGMVGFFGLASAVEQIGDIPQETLLPGAGIGFRYMMIPKERINIGLDVAKGKDDWGIYFRIGESFGR